MSLEWIAELKTILNTGNAGQDERVGAIFGINNNSEGWTIRYLLDDMINRKSLINTLPTLGLFN